MGGGAAPTALAGYGSAFTFNLNFYVSGSQFYAVQGAQQGGETFYGPHAVLWNSSGSSYLDLNPTGANYSWIKALNGSQQAGMASFAGFEHAVLWSGSADNFVDLTPSGFTDAAAYGMTATQQVGDGRTSHLTPGHALLWNGSAASYVDLNPAGASQSHAYGIAGNQQAGWARLSGNIDHPILWTGTAASAVDLLPAGYSSGYGNGTNGTQQIGTGSGPLGGPLALL